MTTVLILLLVQGALGALDTLWHHELIARLPAREGARAELRLHALREAIYAVIFLSLPWVQWRGAWALALIGLLLLEVVITMTDFLLEDRTRRLPPSERVLHTVMAIGYGVLLAALAPVLLAWLGEPTGFAAASYGWLSWTATLLGLGVLAWTVRDGMAALRPDGPAWREAPRIKGPAILVTGATGFIGTALVRRLQRMAYRVVVLTRDPMRARADLGPGVVALESLGQLPDETRLHAIVNLAGAPISGGRWTAVRRRALVESRVRTTREVVRLIGRLERKPQALISASGAGFYGERGTEVLDELSGPAAGFMSQICRVWEEEASAAEAFGVRVCRLRLGLVLDWSGGILPLLALPALFGLGAVLGSGRQWMAWVHLDDVLAAITTALEDERYAGAVNLVAPEAITQGQLAHALAFTLRRPQWLAVPAWPIRLALGEMSDLLMASQCVQPRRLVELGFRFSRGQLSEALEPARAPIRPRASYSTKSAAVRPV